MATGRRDKDRLGRAQRTADSGQRGEMTVEKCSGCFGKGADFLSKVVVAFKFLPSAEEDVRLGDPDAEGATGEVNSRIGSRDGRGVDKTCLGIQDVCGVVGTSTKGSARPTKEKEKIRGVTKRRRREGQREKKKNRTKPTYE